MAPSSASDDPLSEVDLDCSIYVDSENREGVLESVMRSVRGRIELHGVVVSQSMRLRAAHNDYETDGLDPSDFIGWPSVLECEPLPGVGAATYVDTVGAALTALWTAGYRAVAACDFEDRLPYSGGMARYS
jgi:hypothetical protein